MLLAIDIGNTNIVMGVFKASRLFANWRISSSLTQTADEYGILLLDLLHTKGTDEKEIDGLILSSVAPSLTPVFVEMSRRYFRTKPIIVDSRLKTDLDIRYQPPGDVGADRIVNAVAAFHRVKGLTIIVDFGTATTFCAISGKGEYLGGAICPGVTISAEALFRKASKLPKVELVRPPSVVGTNTTTSIQAGLIYGYAGMVDAMVRRMKRGLGPKTHVIATGGQAPLIIPETTTIHEVRPYLTLEGLRILYGKNRPISKRKHAD